MPRFRRAVLVVCQIHFDGWRDAINRRLYRKFICQLFLDTLLVLPNAQCPMPNA
ncbi:MAG: hypothetical protein HWQ37_02585 [Nostoc sp. NMS4]|nr:hypothetical protein [Nostoc sp. NMS4]